MPATGAGVVLGRISFWSGVLGTVFGIFGTIFAIWVYVETKETKLLNYQRATRAVFVPPKYFAADVRIGGSDDAKSGFSESVLTIWNSGSSSVRDEDVRIPITIDAGNVGKIVGARIIDSKSAIAANFRIVFPDGSNVATQRVYVRFKIFDPRMATKIALLYQGNGAAMSVAGNLGPGFQIIEYEASLSFTFRVFIWGAAFLFFLAIGAAAIKCSYYIEKRFSPKYGWILLMAAAIFNGVIINVFIEHAERVILIKPPFSVSE